MPFVHSYLITGSFEFFLIYILTVDWKTNYTKTNMYKQVIWVDQLDYKF